VAGMSVMPGENATVPGVGLSGKERKLVLNGSCLDLLPWCEGMCCRWLDVGLTCQEYESGAYEAERFCLLTSESCKETQPACPNRRLLLRKGSDGSCVYLQDNKCSIYATRPQACRKFTCKGGWRLATVFPLESAADASTGPGGKDQFISSLTDEMVFVRHPLVKLVTLFYLEEKKTVVFVARFAGSCRLLAIREPFSDPHLARRDLLDLIALFEAKDSLGEVRRQFAANHGRVLEKRELDEAVWLLSKSRVIMNADAFRRTLTGIGKR
jgi:hypothetical protein